MKKFFLIFSMAFVAMFCHAFAEASTDILYLNNGTVLTGRVDSVANNTSVTFVTEEGKSYTYPMMEVRKIERNSELKTPVSKKTGYADYRVRDLRFFFAVELQGAYAITPRTSTGFATDLNVVAGCRINEYVRVGVGAGVRYNINGTQFRSKEIACDWSYPLFVNVRGNIISEEYRDAVPYYSLDAGYTFGDNGFMIRPSLGYRFGISHSAFLLALSYCGQISNKDFLSFVGLKLGYEF